MWRAGSEALGRACELRWGSGLRHDQIGEGDTGGDDSGTPAKRKGPIGSLGIALLALEGDERGGDGEEPHTRREVSGHRRDARASESGLYGSEGARS